MVIRPRLILFALKSISLGLGHCFFPYALSVSNIWICCLFVLCDYRWNWICNSRLSFITPLDNIWSIPFHFVRWPIYWNLCSWSLRSVWEVISNTWLLLWEYVSLTFCDVSLTLCTLYHLVSLVSPWLSKASVVKCCVANNQTLFSPNRSSEGTSIGAKQNLGVCYTAFYNRCLAQSRTY